MGRAPRSLAPYVAALRACYGEQARLPSLAQLRRMWDLRYSAMAGIVARLRRAGVVVGAAGKLRPGPAFMSWPEAVPAGQDRIDIAEREWSFDSSERDAQLYALSTRILYVASLVEWSFERESQKHGLNSGEMLVIDALRRLGPPYEASPAQLRAHFIISFAGIGKRLTRLEQLGYVERRAHETDGRSQIIRLTDKGLALLRSSREGNEDVHTRALRNLPPGQARTLAAILRNVQQEIDAARSEER